MVSTFDCAESVHTNLCCVYGTIAKGILCFVVHIVVCFIVEHGSIYCILSALAAVALRSLRQWHS